MFAFVVRRVVAMAQSYRQLFDLGSPNHSFSGNYFPDSFRHFLNSGDASIFVVMNSPRLGWVARNSCTSGGSLIVNGVRVPFGPGFFPAPGRDPPR